MPSSTSSQQVDYIVKISNDQEERARFLADPEKAAKRAGVTLDKGFATAARSELLSVEKETARLGMRNPFVEKFKVPGVRVIEPGVRVGGARIVMNAAAVAAGAAVVAAAAAVVTAVTAVYNSTKFASPGGRVIR